jgi:IstB-like ATP binding protein
LLQHPTIDRLRELGLDGMVKNLRDLVTSPESKALDHMEWLGILLEHEMTLRQQKRFEARARTASCATSPPWRISTTGPRAVSTARCS